jgi:hypothetical protein
MTEEPTLVDMQAHVQKHWESVRYDGNRILAKRPGGGEWILSGNTNCMFERSHRMSIGPAWKAAYEFTVKHQENIRLIEEEIHLLEGWRFVAHAENPAALRLLAREQEQLATLKKGMKDA